MEASGKRVAVWAADVQWDPAAAAVDGHRPASDIAEVGWFNAEQARRLLRPGQEPLLGRLERVMRAKSA